LRRAMFDFADTGIGAAKNKNLNSGLVKITRGKKAKEHHGAIRVLVVSTVQSREIITQVREDD